jgi:hypothetical protein
MSVSTQPTIGVANEARFDSDSPAFLITIDTEGDNLWSRPRCVTTENARFLPRFQTLCERFGLKPIYLVDYDMGRSREFIEFGLDAIKRSQAEIGMHLHPWNTPPNDSLTSDDLTFQPYLVEYPESAIRDKVALMTDMLGETFGVPIRSHRAGRWAFNETYARVLIDCGYAVDCSVTPNVSWRDNVGDPAGQGGTDYREFPGRAYWVDPDDIRRDGTSRLLEIPMSIRPCRFASVKRIRQRCGERALISRVLSRLVPRYTWFRPRRGNLAEMLGILRWVKRQGIDYVEFILHSSEFMPGGSPTFVTEADIERLYESLEELFQAATSASFQGATLIEYHAQYTREHAQR